MLPAAVLAAAGLRAAPPTSFLFILADDLGWADFSYNNGTARTPRIKAWTEADGTVTMQDFHSGGTVCSPTRATVLTGRNHFRDCVNYVYGCSDMTECVPDFEFAAQTFTVADAARAAGRGYVSHFGGKWHLGSFYNDSEQVGARFSSPISHGFDRMNATVEVSPTATTNCECSAAWQPGCNYGHYGRMAHCSGGAGPDPGAKPGCCFNYWAEADAPHGVVNQTHASPDDDASHNADAFVRFVESLGGAPFLAQVSFHNCHVPFIGTAARKGACNSTKECGAVLPGAKPYSDTELDFYACLNELDTAVGTVIDALKRLEAAGGAAYYDDTMIWFTADNGPEVNCKPEGRCGSRGTGAIPPGTLHRPDCHGPGSAGPLRGRKRDVWEGGHRVPGIVSWPAVVKGAARESWHPVVTMDFLATVIDVLGIDRPQAQKSWHFDGVSIAPILRGETPAPRGIGWMYQSPIKSVEHGYAYRYGKWKYVAGGVSCNASTATFNCSKEQLYDLEADLAEDHDLAARHPDVLAAIAANFTKWYDSVWDSRVNESKCQTGPDPPGPGPAPVPFPKPVTPSSACTFTASTRLGHKSIAHGTVSSKEECCGACIATEGCAASEYVEASPMRPTWDGETKGGQCTLKAVYDHIPFQAGHTVCRPN